MNSQHNNRPQHPSQGHALYQNPIHYTNTRNEYPPQMYAQMVRRQRMHNSSSQILIQAMNYNNSSRDMVSLQSSEFKSMHLNSKPTHQMNAQRSNNMNHTMNNPKNIQSSSNHSISVLTNNKQHSQSISIPQQKHHHHSYQQHQHQRRDNKTSTNIQSQPTHNHINHIKPSYPTSISSSSSSSQPPHLQHPSHSPPIIQQAQFHPSYFLLSKFPLLIPKDQIYIPIINRLQNHQTIYCFNELYINLKFLLIQSDIQFWKYLSHLYFVSINGLSDQQVREGYKLRLALQSCLNNFSIKQFNKCINVNDVNSSSISKRIYKYENIFNSTSFRIYDKLYNSVLQFYQRILKATNPLQINIVISSWYIDTLKVMQLATIYGSKQPIRIKQLIKQMFTLNPKVFTLDFVNFIQKLYQYIDTSQNHHYNHYHQQQAFSLLTHLDKKISAIPTTNTTNRNKHKQKYKSNFHNPQQYFAKEIFFLCSDCLKLFIYVTNIFKFYPSRLKLILMENTDFLRALIKISMRVIYNLKVQKKRWKMSTKVKSLIKDLQFILFEKVTEMYKFIFLNTKNALQQMIFSDQQEQKTIQQIKQQKIIIKFYKKLIEGTVNRKKDAEKDKNIFSFLKQQEGNSETNNIQQSVEESGLNEKEQCNKSSSGSKQDSLMSLQSQEDKSKEQQQKSKDCQKGSENKRSSDKVEKKVQQKKQSRPKKDKILQSEYGRVILKCLLRKQLKKDINKYKQSGYFYSARVYSQLKNRLISKSNSKQRNQQQQNLSQTVSIQNGLLRYLLVLQQFETQVRQKYIKQRQIDERFRIVDLLMRQLPTLEEFRKVERRREYVQLMRKLQQQNKEYEDEPTEQEEVEMEMEWGKVVVEDTNEDDDDVTKIGVQLFGHEDVIQFININSNKDDIDLSFNRLTGGIALKKDSTFIQQWTVINNNKNSNKIMQINKNKNKQLNKKNNNNKRRYFQGESSSSSQLSAQEITQSQLLTQQILSNNSHLAISPTDNNRSINSSNNNTSINSNNINININQIKNPIFKPHQTLPQLSYSMIKEQLQYFNKVKNLNWHQISRISIKNINNHNNDNDDNNKNKNNKNKIKNKSKNSNNSISQDESLIQLHKMIKVQDIGLSFDMILGESQQQQQCDNIIKNYDNFSYFYYNQWRHESTRYKKKSFMEDYSWTKVESSVERNSVIIQGSNMNKKDKGDSNKDSNRNVNKMDKDNDDQRLNVMRMKKRGIVGRQEMKLQQSQKVSNSNSKSSGNNNNSLKVSIHAHNDSSNGSTKNAPIIGGVMLHPPIQATQSYYNNFRPTNNYYNNQLNTINNLNDHSISQHHYHQHHPQAYQQQQYIYQPQNLQQQQQHLQQNYPPLSPILNYSHNTSQSSYNPNRHPNQQLKLYDRK